MLTSITWAPALAPTITSTVICAFILWLLLRYFRHTLLPDHANHRSLHTGVIPRFGGIAIIASIGLTIGFLHGRLPPLFWPVSLIFLLALLDDWRNLPWWVRFPIQTLAAIWVVATLPGAIPWWWAIIAILAIQWSTNLFNFMDGMDGLAGTMAFIGFTGLWLATGGRDNLPLIIAGACLGFLCFNLHPARVFMGDSGSTSLGMLAATLSIKEVHNGAWAWPIPVLIFLPFVYDASSTLLIRLLAKKPVWQAHREHMYQRAFLAGYSVNVVWGMAAGSMVLCAGVALALIEASFSLQLGTLLMVCSVFAMAQYWLYRQNSRSKETVK